MPDEVNHTSSAKAVTGAWSVRLIENQVRIGYEAETECRRIARAAVGW